MTDTSRTVAHPGLDGLRGLAVAAVLLYHAGFGWARGGYLGVSVFFTLSGYLITSLLLGEHDRRGGISLVAFWRRRFRRLLPASVVALAGVCLFGATVASAEQRADLGGDVVSALLGVANWRFVLQEVSYGDLFAAPSPVLHFWSLAIEMQFYVVFPPLVAGALVVGRARRGAVGLLVGTLIAGSVALTMVLGGDDIDRIYFGTATRASELLVGALLAVVVAGRRRERGRVVERALDLSGAVAIVVLGWACAVVAQDSGWLYRGGFTGIALVSVVAVASLARTSRLGAVVGAAPLRWLGLRSYAIYLYHWPIYLWLSEDRTGLDPVPLLALRLVVTFALAEASHHLVEAPFRRQAVGRRTFLAVAPAGTVGVVVLALVLSATAPAPALVFRDEVAAAPEVTHEPTRVVVVGGSLATAFADALEVAADPSTTAVVDATVETCVEGEEASLDGVEPCRAVERTWSDAVSEASLAVILVGPGDPLGRDGAALERVRAGAGDGVEVVWITHPLVGSWAGTDPGRSPQPPFGVAATPDAVATRDAVTAVVADIAARSGDQLIDLARNLEPPPVGDPPVQVDAVLDAGAPEVAAALDAAAQEVLEGSGGGPGTVRILFVGDSIGQTMATGFVAWAGETGRAAVWDVTRPGCSWIAEGESEMPGSQNAGCLGWVDDFPRYVEEFDPDLVLVQQGVWDLLGRRVEGDPDLRYADDPVVADVLARTYRDALERLTAGGARVVWFPIPCFGPSALEAIPRSEASRAAHEAILAQLADELDGVDVVDIDALTCPGGTYEPALGGIPGSRPDDIHFTPEAARWLAEALTPAIGEATGFALSDA